MTIEIAQLNQIVPDLLTCQKAMTIMTQGYEPSGFCFRHPRTGTLCIVEQCAVRVVLKDEAWELIHPKQP